MICTSVDVLEVKGCKSLQNGKNDSHSILADSVGDEQQSVHAYLAKMTKACLLADT